MVAISMRTGSFMSAAVFASMRTGSFFVAITVFSPMSAGGLGGVTVLCVGYPFMFKGGMFTPVLSRRVSIPMLASLQGERPTQHN